MWSCLQVCKNGEWGRWPLPHASIRFEPHEMAIFVKSKTVEHQQFYVVCPNSSLHLSNIPNSTGQRGERTDKGRSNVTRLIAQEMPQISGAIRSDSEAGGAQVA